MRPEKPQPRRKVDVQPPLNPAFSAGSVFAQIGGERLKALLHAGEVQRIPVLKIVIEDALGQLAVAADGVDGALRIPLLGKFFSRAVQNLLPARRVLLFSLHDRLFKNRPIGLFMA